MTKAEKEKLLIELNKKKEKARIQFNNKKQSQEKIDCALEDYEYFERFANRIEKRETTD